MITKMPVCIQKSNLIDEIFWLSRDKQTRNISKINAYMLESVKDLQEIIRMLKKVKKEDQPVKSSDIEGLTDELTSGRYKINKPEAEKINWITNFVISSLKQSPGRCALCGEPFELKQQRFGVLSSEHQKSICLRCFGENIDFMPLVYEKREIETIKKYFM